MVTASHNPPDYNGMKFVREGSRPISADNGLFDMRALIQGGQLPRPRPRPGTEQPLDIEARDTSSTCSATSDREAAPAEGGGERRQRRRGLARAPAWRSPRWAATDSTVDSRSSGAGFADVVVERDGLGLVGHWPHASVSARSISATASMTARL